MRDPKFIVIEYGWTGTETSFETFTEFQNAIDYRDRCEKVAGEDSGVDYRLYELTEIGK